MGLMALGIGLMAGSQVMEGISAQKEGAAEAKMADYNAKVEEQQARAIEQKTAYDQSRQADISARRQSSLSADLAASGAVTSSGSPLLIKAKQASEDELAMLNIGYEGATNASQARTAAAGYKIQGKYAKIRGQNKALGSYLGAGSTLLTGFGWPKAPKKLPFGASNLEGVAASANDWVNYG
jgi:hypothetical protein